MIDRGVRRRGVAALLLAAAAWVQPAAAQVPDGRSAPVLRPSLPAETPAGALDNAAVPTLTTLDAAIARAYWTNPTLIAERATLKSVDPLFAQARASYGPQLSLQASHLFARDRREVLPGLFSRPEGFSSTAQLIFSQPLLPFGRLAAAEQGALAQIALSREELRLSEASTMFGVVSAYVSVVRDRAILDFARQNLALLERQYSESRERFAVRDITSSDLQQVETRLAFGRAQLLNAQGALGSSQSLFLQFTGGLPGELAVPAPISLGVPTLDAAYAVAETASPIVRGAQAREKVSRAAVAAARAQRNPEVSLQASGLYGPSNLYQNQLRSTELRSSVVVNLPIIDSGIRRTAIERARQANEADWRLVDAALRETRQSVAEAWDGYRSALESLEHYRAAAAAAQAAYDGAVIQERAGDRTTLDVLDLARDLLNVRTSFATAEANEYLSRARLLGAMGNLEAPKLVPGIAAYDPTANFQRVRRKGDVPLLTPLVSGIDQAIGGALRDDRPSGEDRPIRDPSAGLRNESAVIPIPPSPAPTTRIPPPPGTSPERRR
ncbi:TolC family protein [uncultured Sphingomonas sp.]|uniref:TolC family protein n=1 Tax=uncultured Sphingomonas sp. TaxID=158754 RepID=UPI0025885D93|nr:TolC family protein [uncultured Sphingomonas sp.]